MTAPTLRRGEAIIRVGLVQCALAELRAGADPEAAAHAGLATLAERVGATAGLILVDAHGRIGAAHTTAAMPTASRTD